MRKLMLLVLLLLFSLTVAVAEEPLVYNNETYGLAFELPDGWKDILTETDVTLFTGPEDSLSSLAVGTTGIKVDEAFAAAFDAAIVETWILDGMFPDFVLTDVMQYMFESAVIEDGRLYAYNLCGIVAEGFPEDFVMLCLQYFFTDADGVLGSVTLVTPAGDASFPILEWFDIVVIENIPMEAWDALFAKLDLPLE